MATSDVWSRSSQVFQQLGTGTSFVQSVGQDRKAQRVHLAAWQKSPIVSSVGQGNDCGRQPSGIECERTEGVAKDVAQQANTVGPNVILTIERADYFIGCLFHVLS
jgi:hypothetical protein